MFVHYDQNKDPTDTIYFPPINTYKGVKTIFKKYGCWGAINKRIKESGGILSQKFTE
jgi:hypothetical protein